MVSFTSFPQRREPESRSCMQAVYFGKESQGTGIRDWQEGNWEGGQVYLRVHYQVDQHGAQSTRVFVGAM